MKLALSNRSPMNVARRNRSSSGFTLVELSVTVATILALVGIASLGVGPYNAYRDGQAASETLRTVKAAQLMFLADNPARAVSSLQQSDLLPYMPNNTLWPILPKVSGQTPTINCAVFPPVAVLNGMTYDPSPSTTDGLWDVGQW
jgi:type II secretory pathway pseudopilin PulG